MYDDNDVAVSETRLPGVGMRQDFLTEHGRRLGVVSHRNGRRELLVFSKEDPDACSQVLQLTPSEADALAQMLGSGGMAEKLATLSEQISNLATGKVQIPVGSRYDGLTLGETKARTRTGASIVALMRGADVIPSPGPQTGLLGGDILVVVGTVEGIKSVKRLVDE